MPKPTKEQILSYIESELSAMYSMPAFQGEMAEQEFNSDMDRLIRLETGLRDDTISIDEATEKLNYREKMMSIMLVIPPDEEEELPDF